MIIDDDAGMVESLKIGLKPAGYDIITFSDPLKGITAYKEDHYDVVITDFRMPKMNGIEVLKTIRNLDAEAFVIILTAYADTENTITALNLGAYGFFRKPFKIGKLIKTLMKIEQELRFKNEFRNYNKEITNGFIKIKRTLDYLENITKKNLKMTP